MLLSFIIPVYNASSCITATLDSIYSLHLEECQFEVILIDDCSTDNSVDVIRDYSKNYTNIVLLRQNRNHRQGAARNRGIAVAKGEYITFVDSDDFVNPCMADVIQQATDVKVDVLCAMSSMRLENHCGDDTVIKVFSAFETGKIYTGREFCNSPVLFCGNNGTPWGYLFRTEYVRSTGRLFIEDHLFEETDWIAYHFYHAASLLYSSSVIYTYIIQPDSVMAKDMSINYVADSCKLAVRMMKIADEFDSTDARLKSLWYSDAETGLLKKGLRWKFLSKYQMKDIVMFYRLMGKDDLDYLKGHYSGDSFIRCVCSHKLITVVIMAALRCAFICKNKALGRSNIKRNFYGR